MAAKQDGFKAFVLDQLATYTGLSAVPCSADTACTVGSDEVRQVVAAWRAGTADVNLRAIIR